MYIIVSKTNETLFWQKNPCFKYFEKKIDCIFMLIVVHHKI